MEGVKHAAVEEAAGICPPVEFEMFSEVELNLLRFQLKRQKKKKKSPVSTYVSSLYAKLHLLQCFCVYKHL